MLCLSTVPGQMAPQGDCQREEAKLSLTCVPDLCSLLPAARPGNATVHRKQEDTNTQRADANVVLHLHLE